MDRDESLFDHELKQTVFGLLLLCNIVMWGTFALGLW